MTKINIQDVVDAINFSNAENELSFHIQTGQIYCLPMEYLIYTMDELKDARTFQDWELDIINVIKDTHENPDDYLLLPSSYEINDYHIMENFIDEITNEKQKIEFTYAIRGKGAFQRFNYLSEMFNLRDQWYKYRDHAYLTIAKDWCHENNIDYDS